jgi:hypothetical protein
MPRSRLVDEMRMGRSRARFDDEATNPRATDPVLDIAASQVGEPAPSEGFSGMRPEDLKFGEGVDASAAHAAKWHALIACMAVGPELHRLLKGIIASHGAETRPADEMPDEPLARLECIRGRLDALHHRYGEILGRFLAWTTDLRAKMAAVQAQLDGVPLIGAVDEAFSTLSRLYRRLQVPPAPEVDVNDPASLEARAKWLRETRELARQAEGFAGEYGRAIIAVDQAMDRFALRAKEVATVGTRSTVSAFLTSPPPRPDLVSFVAIQPRPAPKRDPYAHLYE